MYINIFLSIGFCVFRMIEVQHDQKLCFHTDFQIRKCFIPPSHFNITINTCKVKASCFCKNFPCKIQRVNPMSISWFGTADIKGYHLGEAEGRVSRMSRLLFQFPLRLQFLTTTTKI